MGYMMAATAPATHCSWFFNGQYHRGCTLEGVGRHPRAFSPSDTLRRPKAIETFNIPYIPRIVWGCCTDIGAIMRLPQWVKQPWCIWVNVSCEYKRSRTDSIWRYCLTSIGKAHCEDEAVLRPHYVHNGGFCTGKKKTSPLPQMEMSTPSKFRWVTLKICYQDLKNQTNSESIGMSLYIYSAGCVYSGGETRHTWNVES